MRDALLRILNEFDVNSQQTFAGNVLADFLRHGAPEAIRSAARLTSRYLVKGSAGQGNWVEVPWICVFDKDITTTAQKGYYIVYLFDANMEGVYLSLGIGWTQYEDRFHPVARAQQEIKTMAQYYRDLIKSKLHDFQVPSINLHAQGVLGKGYELGHICGKYYTKDSIPTVDELVEDLQNLRGVYRELKGILSGSPITEPQPRHKAVVNEEQVRQEEAEEEKQAAQLSDEEVRIRATKAETKPPREARTKHYPRNAYVAEHAKRRANGKCELCESPAPFFSRDHKPFLECHHIIERAEGGSDSVDNTVALCPNCHRKMHSLKLAEDKYKLKSKVIGR